MMALMRGLAVCVGVSLAAGPWLWAAVGDDVTVYRTNGVSFQATIVQENEDAITFDVVYDTLTLKRADIARMVPLRALPVAAPSPTRPAASARRQTPPAERVATGFNVGDRAPAFEAQDVEGRSHSIALAAGDVVVLHFWATWCPHCRRSIPALINAHHRYASQGVRLLAISNEDAAVLQRFARQHGLPYPVIASPRALGRYGVRSIPVTVVIDQQGIIRYRQQGAGDGFVAIVEELL